MSWENKAPLGKAADYDRGYDPGLLFSIPRAEGRARIGLVGDLPFSGGDTWNAWELSWLDARGKPEVAWGEFRVPADSPSIIESKSLKLYLNGLNQASFDSQQAVQNLIAEDLSRAAGGPVTVALRAPDDWPQALAQPQGECLDGLDVAIRHYHPEPALLALRSDGVAERRVFSRLLRSRCPVTGQPDWGGVDIRYRGPEIDPAGLLAYIVSFRQHQDFHEQCVERMFLDIQQRCHPERLTIHARYLRRGGLDINPFRTSTSMEVDNQRWFLQ
ncbi:MAG: NADPH-dependent 7-cyano-7-deazaguanine reductase QueF [Ectothiorhodospiraceae bacterium]|nr:NADPH-dependent 7-cyano-7-deazaguanine reductase QueF [Ectothiorhodospiraceae bacterium]MCH8503861.1 NADPH-dependent 7-cyano-7-deazaguanine reductase QueF [Ectothiorhodospiraceae bacterium]